MSFVLVGQIEQEYLAAAKKQNPRRPIGFEDLPEAAPAATNALLDFKMDKKNKKRCAGRDVWQGLLRLRGAAKHRALTHLIWFMWSNECAVFRLHASAGKDLVRSPC